MNAKFFAAFAAGLLMLSANAFAVEDNPSVLKNTESKEFVLGNSSGLSSEFTFENNKNISFTKNVYLNKLPNNVGEEIVFEASNGEFFKVCRYTGAEVTNASNSFEKPQGKPKTSLKSYTIFYSNENKVVQAVYQTKEGTSRMFKMTLR